MADNRDGACAPTLLLTRPRDASARFALELAARWTSARVVVAPLMDITPTGATLPAGDAAIIFTSGNAVALAGPGRARRAWCVGAQTAEAARRAGFDVVMAGETADALVAHLSRKRPEGRIVHLHGVHQRGDVAERLSKAGLSVEGAAIYDQRPVAPDSLFFDALAARPLIVPLFSPRSAALFAAAAEPSIGGTLQADVALIALSEAVRDALPPSWRGATALSERPDAEAMLEQIARRIYP